MECEGFQRTFGSFCFLWTRRCANNLRKEILTIDTGLGGAIFHIPFASHHSFQCPDPAPSSEGSVDGLSLYLAPSITGRTSSPAPLRCLPGTAGSQTRTSPGTEHLPNGLIAHLFGSLFHQQPLGRLAQWLTVLTPLTTNPTSEQNTCRFGNA